MTRTLPDQAVPSLCFFFWKKQAFRHRLPRIHIFIPASGSKM